MPLIQIQGSFVHIFIYDGKSKVLIYLISLRKIKMLWNNRSNYIDHTLVFLSENGSVLFLQLAGHFL